MISYANRRTVAVALASFGVGFVLTGAVVAGWTDSLDSAVNDIMVSWETPWLVSVSVGLSDLGSVPIVLGVIALLLGWFTWKNGLWWLLMVLVAIVVSEVLEDLVRRPRPAESLIHKTSWSFPSGHAMVSGLAIGLGSALFAIRRGANAGLVLTAGVAYAAAQSLSRVYLRAHWLTDIIGAALLGFGVVLAMIALWDHPSDRRRTRTQGSTALS